MLPSSPRVALSVLLAIGAIALPFAGCVQASDAGAPGGGTVYLVSSSAFSSSGSGGFGGSGGGSGGENAYGGASASSDSTTTTATGAGGGTAPGPMVEIHATGGTFSIDATEVTNGAYRAFLASLPSVAVQTPACAWNTTFEPEFGGLPVGRDDEPVGSVNWCDAYAYCQWAGKRLCGAIGGGATPFNAYGDAATSQWTAACAGPDEHVYPYGDVYQPGICNGEDFGAHAVIAVASDSGCQGGTPGLYDMSGNAFEWEDDCDGESGRTDVCRLRGGSWNDLDLQCTYGTSDTQRQEASPNFGFRCCGP